MMDFDYCDEYLRSISKKYFYGGVKKSKCSFSCPLQIDKKINIKKINEKIPKEKNWSFDFSQAA